MKTEYKKDYRVTYTEVDKNASLSLPNQFLEQVEITDFEIHYINESVENQVLEIYKKEKNDEIDFLIKEENKGKEIVRANLKYKKCGEKSDI